MSVLIPVSTPLRARNACYYHSRNPEARDSNLGVLPEPSLRPISILLS